MKPSFNEFANMGTGAEFIPVCREFLADLETPVSVLRRFAEEKHVFLLESVEGGERFGRYSIIGVNPYGIFTVEDGQAYLSSPGKPKEALGEKGKGFFALRSLMKEARALTYPGLPPLFGGAVGSLDYEVVSEFEKIPLREKKEDRPEALFMLTREMIVFDTMKHTVMIVVSVRRNDFSDANRAYKSAEERIAAIRERMTAPLPVSELEPEVMRSEEIKLTSNMTKEDYCQAVEKAKELIAEGEIIQVVPAQKF
ncbi:anthranilate synthase component I, partial [bacterium]|nr:anthranilate synthase component I [bacterium]